MEKSLNKIRINLGELRKDIAALQADGYDEVGLEDLLVYIKASLNARGPVRIENSDPEQQSK